MNELLTIKEAHEKFNIHPSRIYKAVKRGNIQGNKRGNTYLVIEKEVEEYFQSEISQQEKSKEQEKENCWLNLNHAPDKNEDENSKEYKIVFRYLNGIPVTSSAGVAKIFNLDHEEIVNTIAKLIKDDPLIAAKQFFPIIYFNRLGRLSTNYDMTMGGLGLLTGNFKGSKVKQLRMKYIEAFGEFMACSKPENQNIDVRDKTRKEIMPEGELYDDLAYTTDAITFREASRMLGIYKVGQNKLFRILRDCKILMEDNTPYQRYINSGYFKVIEQRYSCGEGQAMSHYKTLITQRGLVFVRNDVQKYLETNK